MIDSVSLSPAPRRLAMGSSTYAHIREALATRLTELDALKDITLSADETAWQEGKDIRSQRGGGEPPFRFFEPWPVDPLRTMECLRMCNY